MANKEYLINDEIKLSQVRLKVQEGSILMSLEEALKKAQEENKDLIQIASDGESAICRIIEEDKFKYELQKKEKAKTKKQPPLKRISFSLLIHDKDTLTKQKALMKFLKGGHKVKISVRLLKKQMVGEFSDKAKNHLLKIVEGLHSLGKFKIEGEPQFEGREASVIVASSK